MQIDDKLLAHLQDISFLTLSDGEKNLIKKEMQEIFHNMTQFNELFADNLNSPDISQCSHPLPNVNVFRDDKVQPSFDRSLILKNAPARNEEMFIAPKTVE